MEEDLTDAILDDSWTDVVNALFSDHEGDYYHACINENLKKAQELFSRGHFADKTFLWNYYACNCRLEGCLEKYGFPPISLLMIGNAYLDLGPNKDLENKLVDYELLPVEAVLSFLK